MTGTIIQQGRFTSDGTAKSIPIRSGVDWIWVYNETILNDAALAADRGAQFYFQRGMTNGRGIEYRKLGTVANDPITTLQVAANAGIFFVDSSNTAPTAAVAVTAITNSIQPIMSTADTGALVTGSVVRLQGDTGVPNIMGFDFEVGTVVANTNFRMRWALANTSGAVGAGNGTYRQIPFDPIFYPRNRYIVNVTQAAQAVVTLSVQHQYTVGQQIRFQCSDSAFGMVELDGLQATIVAVSTVNNTITVDLDTTAFTAFDWPLAAAVPFTIPQVVPIGENTAQALLSGVDILADATYNSAFSGVVLAAGNNSPAGAANDVISWIAGTSFSVNNS